MDGLLVVDKPVGPTSHDVVARLRRVLGERRVGHTGTLDPLASGVLALVVGRATRLAQFMGGDDKAYDATIRLGVATSTYDAEGVPIGAPVDGPWPGREDVVQALEAFQGTHLQHPPAYSAKKVAGRRSYERARRGAPDDMRPAPALVTLKSLAITGYRDGVVDLHIVCSAGFYVRSLAHDVGARLGIGAHLAALRRTRSGSLTLGDAVRLADLEASRELARASLRPMSAMLPALPAVVLTAAALGRVAHGCVIGPEDFAGSASEDGPVRLLSPDGLLVAIARPTGQSGVLHPSVVLM